MFLMLPPRGVRPIRAALAVPIVLALVLAVLGSPPGRAAAPIGARLLAADDQGLTLELRSAEPILREQRLEGQNLQTLEAPGMAPLDIPGSPALPVASVLVALPPEGEPRLVLEPPPEAEVLTLAVPRLAPGSAPVALPDASDAAALSDAVSADGPPQSLLRDPAVYGRTDWWPAAPARIAEIGWLRGQRVARLELAPLQLLPATGALRLHRQLRLRVAFGPAGHPGRFAGDPLAAIDAPLTPDGPLERFVSAAVLNPEQARIWRGRSAAPAATDAAEPSLPSGQHLANIGVRVEGMVRVDAARLTAAGISLAGLDPRKLQLFRQGVEQAVQVVGEADGSFDAGDMIVFFGQASGNRYDAQEVYQLYLGTGAGLRMAGRAASPGIRQAPTDVATTLRVDLQKKYVSDLPYYLRGQLIRPDDMVDRWYSDRVSVGRDVVQALSGLDAAPGGWQAELRVALIGKSSFSAVNPDHQVRVLVGGQQVGQDETFDGNRDFNIMRFSVPAALLQTGSVDITFVAPGGTPASFDQFYVDWIELDYRRRSAAAADRLALVAAAGQAAFDVTGFSNADLRVYDVSDPALPVALSGVDVQPGAAFTARWNGLGQGERYWAVATSGLLAPDSVIDRRMAQAQRSVVSPPSGADYLMISHPDFIGAMAPLVAARQAQGHTVALIDVRDIYDAFSGGQVDADAIRAFVQHAYHHWPTPQPYYLLLVGDGSFDVRNRLGNSNPTFIPPYLKLVDPWLAEVPSENAFVTVAGDDYLPDLLEGRLPVASVAEATAQVAKILAYESAPDGPWRERLLFVSDDADSGGDFYGLSDAIVNGDVPARYTVDKAYYKQNYSSVTDMRSAMLAGLQQGYLLVQYVGHGQPQNWAAEGLLRSVDTAGLRNAAALPVWLEWTCLAGSFQLEQGTSISEAAVRNPSGGAIASFGPSGFGVANGHDYMNSAFVGGWLETGVRELGALTLVSKLNLYRSTGAYHDLIETYHLLGDPAMLLLAPAGAPQVAPSPTPLPTLPATATLPPSATPLPTATATATPTPIPSATPTATRRPTDTPSPTNVPPTNVPPTNVPPTNVPPTDVPPTNVPPTGVPPTGVPPTGVPPTGVPPTGVPPTDVPPTEVPPTDVPPTDVPPTDVPPPTATEAPETGLSIGNRVFSDIDGDGRFEPQSGELGIDGVLLNLYFDSDASGILSLADTWLASTVSAGAGFYRFADVPEGDLIVAVDAANFASGGLLEGLPSSWGNNQSGQAPDPDNDVDDDDNGSPAAVFGVVSRALTLRSGTEPDSTVDGDGADGNQTLDFGFQAHLCLGDRVFADLNNDGLFRPLEGEYGLVSLPLDLYHDADGSGDLSPDDSLLGSQSSGVGGRYRFCGLTPGNYILRIAPGVFAPEAAYAGFRSSTGNERLGRAPDPDDDRDQDDNGFWDAEWGIVTLPVTLREAGEPPQAVDGDSTLSNLTLDLGLTQQADLPSAQPSPTPTATPRPRSTGTASATARPTSTSRVTATPPPSATVLPPTSVPPPSTTPLPSAVAPVRGLCLGNTLFYDLNNDGRFQPEAGEFGLSGIPIDLYRDTDGSGGLSAADTPAGRSSSERQGRFTYCGLDAGAYLLSLDEGLFIAGGLLEDISSSSGNDVSGLAPDPDDDVDGDDNGGPAPGGGIATWTITLVAGQEPPVAADGDDSDSNGTVDIGLTLNLDPTAAAVGGLTATAGRRGLVAVRWSAGKETGIAGYRLQRAARPGGVWRPVGQSVEAGAGDAPVIYQVQDTLNRPGMAYYRLEIIRTDGRVTRLGPVAARMRW